MRCRLHARQDAMTPNRTMTVCWAWALALFAVLLGFQADAQSVKWRPEVVIAYPLTFNAWKLAIFKGTFERVTGWTIKWLELSDANKAVVTLGAGESQIVVANSLDVANAMSRDIDCKIIWTVQANCLRVCRSCQPLNPPSAG